MRDLVQFLSRNPFGVAAPLLLVGFTIAGDLDAPGFVGFILGAAGVIAFFAHSLSSAGPWFSKKISYGEALANAIGPMMLVWVIAVGIRASVLGILGKPL